MTITTEDDPTPLVLIMANVVRRSEAANPNTVAKLKGVAAVRSMHDPQAVTLRFANGDVHLEHGVAADAGVRIAMDFDLDGLPGAPKPKVSGALRHLRFAMGLAKVLEPPLPDLATATSEFWAAASSVSGMPSGLRMIATDTGEVGTAGDDGTEVYEISGPVDRLVRILTGQAVALVELEGGRCNVRGSLGAAVALTRATVLYGMGELRVEEGAHGA